MMEMFHRKKIRRAKSTNTKTSNRPNQLVGISRPMLEAWRRGRPGDTAAAGHLTGTAAAFQLTPGPRLG